MKTIFLAKFLLSTTLHPPICQADTCDQLNILKAQYDDRSDVADVSDNCLRNFAEFGECTREERIKIVPYLQRLNALSPRIAALKKQCK